MMRTLASWNYGGDPLEPLSFEEPLQAIKAKVTAGESLFENLIKTYILENPTAPLSSSNLSLVTVPAWKRKNAPASMPSGHR
ncbi:MAG: hypothetical protein HC806_07550 [Anaerolineae bacterium]|nr:hypothetical protein [Anaerolineae bacterium]